jgi:hypothetical protein
MSISSSIDLNDSEILRLEKGPLAWARLRQGNSLPIDGFVKSLTEQINECGFTVEVKVFDTEQHGVYAFEAEINGRTAGSLFDPDRQVHEVVNNLLELPGQDKGFIPSKDGISKLLNRDTDPKKKHKH